MEVKGRIILLRISTAGDLDMQIEDIDSESTTMKAVPPAVHKWLREQTLVVAFDKEWDNEPLDAFGIDELTCCPAVQPYVHKLDQSEADRIRAHMSMTPSRGDDPRAADPTSRIELSPIKVE